REGLTARDVLVIDEAGLVGTRQLAGVLARVQAAHAKVVLVGDPEQLQAIEAGAPFRGLASAAGFAELNEVRRQRIGWQRQATRQLAHGGTRQALATYERGGYIRAEPTRAAAREAMLAAWWEAGRAHPGDSRLMLAYTREDVQALNTRARALRAAAGELGAGQAIDTERGPREMAAGDRLYFLKNERSLAVKNGSLGTVEAIRDGVLQVRLDGDGQRRVAVDTRWYRHLDHGYAATVYKAQGATVDRTFVLASWHFDRHSTYVALSRHREGVAVFYGREDFRGDYQGVLSRARPKALAHDYLERSPGLERGPAGGVASAHSAPLAERFRQRVNEVAARLALEREAGRVAQEALQRERAHEQYLQFEHRQELVRQHQRELDHGLEL
ncbi:MAG TPA: AAA family ATPase, partial [Candidatus Binataceae bacterium]|nr:AAA family ATPase [Candidatus Binataceae bacterium]